MQISSVKIPSGLSLQLFEHAKWRGKSITLTGDTFELTSFNDVASSAKVGLLL